MSIADAVREKIMRIKEGSGTKVRDILQYGGMNVDVCDVAGKLLFKAALDVTPAGAVTLKELPGSPTVAADRDYIPAIMRGYSPAKNKTVHMRGTIVRLDNGLWMSPDVTVTRVVSERVFFRIHVKVKGMVKSTAGGNFTPCEIRDISVGGARITTAARFAPGDILILTADIDGSGHKSEMQCRVVRVSGGGLYSYNCAFTSIDDKTKKRLTRDIFKAQVKAQI